MIHLCYLYLTTIFQKCNIYCSLTNLTCLCTSTQVESIPSASLTRGLLQTMEFLKIVNSCHLLKAPMYGPCAKLQLLSLLTTTVWAMCRSRYWTSESSGHRLGNCPSAQSWQVAKPRVRRRVQKSRVWLSGVTLDKPRCFHQRRLKDLSDSRRLRKLAGELERGGFGFDLFPLMIAYC